MRPLGVIAPTELGLRARAFTPRAALGAVTLGGCACIKLGVCGHQIGVCIDHLPKTINLLKGIFRSRDQDPVIGRICSETQPLRTRATAGLDIDLAAILMIIRLAPALRLKVTYDRPGATVHELRQTPCKLRIWTSSRRVRVLEIPMLYTVRSSRATLTESPSVSSTNQY